jgi:hypothetical protein
MPKQSSVIVGLVAAIVPAVAIYWLTTGFPWSPKVTPPDSATSLSVEGRVMDATTQRLLSGAVVSLTLAGATNPPDTTDTQGRYLFIVATKPSVPVAANLSVQAQGYLLRSFNDTLDALKALDIQLQPEVAATPTTTPATTPTTTTPATTPASTTPALTPPPPGSSTSAPPPSTEAPVTPPLAVVPKVNLNAIATKVVYRPKSVSMAVRIGAFKK